jgi:hypothetical protein
VAALKAVEALPMCPDAPRSFAGMGMPGPRETMAVAAHDVDQDGFIDAMFVNQLDETITIRWGQPWGGEWARTDVPVGRATYAPIVTDVDEDGHLDLIVGLPDDSAFSVVRGTGQRRFVDPVRIMQGPAPREMRLVNGPDGKSILFAAGDQLYVRPLSHGTQWPDHQLVWEYNGYGQMAIANDIAGLTSLYYSNNSYAMVRHNRLLSVIERSNRSDGPLIIHAFAADLDDSGGEELYVVDEDGRGIHISTSGQMICAITPPGMLGRNSLLVHIDDDGIADHLEALTCGGCTSRHSIELGQPG